MFLGESIVPLHHIVQCPIYGTGRRSAKVYTNMTSTDLISLAKDIFNYNIADQTGWPFEKETGSLPSDGLSYVFADSLEQNVKELHEYLFDNEDYNPSSTVSDISYELYNETGY